MRAENYSRWRQEKKRRPETDDVCDPLQDHNEFIIFLDKGRDATRFSSLAVCFLCAAAEVEFK